MKNFKRKFISLKQHILTKISFFILFFCACNYVSKAQNSSYNANTIPITGTNNSAFGFQSLFSNITGSANTAIGYFALKANTNGILNTGIGATALTDNTTGQENTGVGMGALSRNTIGVRNTGIGLGALTSNTTGSHNTSVGYFSLVNSTIADYNTSIGNYSLISNITGLNNTGLGYFANVASSSLINATAIGSNSIVNASNSIQLGDANVTDIFAGVGTTAKVISGGLQITGGTIAAGRVLTSDLFGNATWQPAGGGGGTGWSITGNTGTVDGVNFLGNSDAIPLSFRINNDQAGRIDFDGNAFYGYRAGISNASRFITGIGSGALENNTTGQYNAAVGYRALFTNTNEPYNTAFGYRALTNSRSYENTAVGSNALAGNITGIANTAVGAKALLVNDDGNQNVAVGGNTLIANVNGLLNTAVGYSALQLNVTNDGNTGIGGYALYNSTGEGNTSVGYFGMLGNTTGQFNSTLGTHADVGSGSLQNASALGAFAVVNSSDYVFIGSTSVTGVETTGTFNNFSDGRFKFNVKEDDVKGLEFINRLRPVVYNLDTKKAEDFLTRQMPDSIRRKYTEGKDFSNSTAVRQSGFIAQEVEQAAKKTGYDFNGVHIPKTENENYSLSYAQFVVPLTKAVQELSKENDLLKKEMAALKDMVKNIVSQNNSGSIKITEGGEVAKLYQNAPNPFNKSTVIRYSIPADAKNAIISISSAAGIKLKEFNVGNKSGQSLAISGGQLAAGTYFYSLYLDGALVDSKQMILTK